MNLKRAFTILGFTATLCLCGCDTIDKNQKSEYNDKSPEEMMALFDNMFDIGDHYTMSDHRVEPKKQSGFKNNIIATTDLSITRDGKKEKYVMSGVMSLTGTKDEFKKLFFDEDITSVTDEMLFEYLNSCKIKYGETYRINDDNSITLEENEGGQIMYYDYSGENPYTPVVYQSHSDSTKYTKKHTIEFDNYSNHIADYKQFKNHFTWDKNQQLYVYDISHAEEDDLNGPLGNATKFTIGISHGKVASMNMVFTDVETNLVTEDLVTFDYSAKTVTLPSGSAIEECEHQYVGPNEIGYNGKRYSFKICTHCGDVIEFHEIPSEE